MKWKKVPAELGDFLEKALKPFNCQKKIMFGCPAYFINNNMFAGLHQEEVFIRLSGKDREKVVGTYEGVHPFEPTKGRIMKEYVVVPQTLYSNPSTFKEFLRLSHDYVASLPPKTPRKKRRNT